MKENTTKDYSSEIRERAVRMGRDYEDEYPYRNGQQFNRYRPSLAIRLSDVALKAQDFKAPSIAGKAYESLATIRELFRIEKHS